MHVTVAICTWNRSRLLRQTLEQLLNLAVPPGMSWELLVVNNNSTDDTDRVLAEFESRLPLRRVLEPNPGLSHARNTALAAASGDYIVFTDDDVLVDPSWLVELDGARRAFPTASAFGGVIVPWFVDEPDRDLAAVFPKSLGQGYCGLDHERDGGALPANLFVWGANMAFRMSAVRGLQFDPSLGVSPHSLMGGEEVDFLGRLRKAGGELIWWPAMKVQHYVLPARMTLEYALQHEQAAGRLHVVSNLRPAEAGPVAVPRWLLTRYLKVGILRWLAYLGPLGQSPHGLFGAVPVPGASRRIWVMTWRRELAWLRGMMQGFRQRPRP